MLTHLLLKTCAICKQDAAQAAAAQMVYLAVQPPPAAVTVLPNLQPGAG